MRYIYSNLLWLFLVVSCLICFPVALVIWLVTLPFDRNGLILHLFSCFWAQLYFYCNPLWKLRVEGREKIPWRGAAVLVSNHQSLADILVLFGLYRPFKWVSKASVFKVPIIGWNMVLNRYIPLVRGDRRSVLAMMEACRTWLKRGVPIMMFPEGTRSRDGNLLPFKDGAFTLAVEAGCPVIPIALTGTADLLPKHGYLLGTRATCRIQVLEPISPAQFGNDVAALREHVRNRIADAVNTMTRQDRPAHGGTNPARANVSAMARAANSDPASEK